MSDISELPELEVQRIKTGLTNVFRNIMLNANIIFWLNGIVVKQLNTYQRHVHATFDISAYLTGDENHDDNVVQLVTDLYNHDDFKCCDALLHNIYKYYGFDIDLDDCDYDSETKVFTFMFYNVNFVTTIKSEMFHFMNVLEALSKHTENIKGQDFFIKMGEPHNIDGKNNKLDHYYESVNNVKKVLISIYEYYFYETDNKVSVNLDCITKDNEDFIKVTYM